LIWNAAWVFAAQLGIAPPAAGFRAPMPAYVAWPLTMNSLYLLLTLLVFTDTRLRFDRIAGRMTQGGVAVAFDEFLYGRPEEPIPIEAEELTRVDAEGPTPEPPAGDWPEAPTDQRRGDAVAPPA
jgi:hypothetical protein